MNNDTTNGDKRRHRRAKQPKQPGANKPYALVGAGQLSASIWKSGDQRAGWRCRFNVFRLNARSGRASQRFTASDVPSLVKLARVLAAVLADDGCITASQRQSLIKLAADIDQFIDPVE